MTFNWTLVYLDITDPIEPAIDVQQVVMFSGGLDSLAGAIDETINQKRKTLLVSHRPTAKNNRILNTLIRTISDRADLNLKPQSVKIRASLQDKTAREYTQRTRSFLFASFGVALAKMLQLDSLRFYENGVISLNLPICAQVVGSRATRTTHPRVLAGFQQLFSLLGERRFTVENPYLWKTKAEVIKVIVDAGFGSSIAESVSCAHTWERKSTVTHCGTCSQCLDRRLAMLAADAEEYDPLDRYKIDVFTEQRSNEDDKILASNYINRANNVARLKSPVELASQYPTVLRALAALPERSHGSPARVFDLYKRHANEVGEAIDKLTKIHSKALRLRTLPAGSLLYGIQLDSERIRQGIQILTTQRDQSAQCLPWYGREKPTSAKALAHACRERNIPAPPSTAEDDPGCDEWEERYGQQAPWIRHIRNWRKSNRMLKVLETMRDRCRADGSLPFSLKYFGAIATGRWSGDAGLNLQNFNREALHEVDPRRCLIARPGHKLIIADLSQIEPRVLAWIAGDHELLEKIRNGLPIYQAHAETSMGFTGGDLKKEAPRRYLLAKCRVIGLGYGAGAKTFQNLAKSYGLTISYSEAKGTVDDFRRQNPKILAVWSSLEKSMRQQHEQTFFMQLPSGRLLRYFGVHAFNGGITAATERGGRRFKWYGGKLTENLVQATARDVFAEGLLRIHRAGIRILWTVHDEVICEVPEDSDVTPDVVSELLAQTPEWMPGLPLDAEASESQAYCK